MTEHDLELYRKCMRKKKRTLTRQEYEEDHEYSTGTNDNDYNKKEINIQMKEDFTQDVIERKSFRAVCIKGFREGVYLLTKGSEIYLTKKEADFWKKNGYITRPAGPGDPVILRSETIRVFEVTETFKAI